MEITMENIRTLDAKTLEFAKYLAWQFEFTCKNTKEGRTLAHAYSNMQKALAHYISEIKEENNVFRCTHCGQVCFENTSPEIVFRDKDNLICEECSIDFEMIGDKVVEREFEYPGGF